MIAQRDWYCLPLAWHWTAGYGHNKAREPQIPVPSDGTKAWDQDSLWHSLCSLWAEWSSVRSRGNGAGEEVASRFQVLGGLRHVGLHTILVPSGGGCFYSATSQLRTPVSAGLRRAPASFVSSVRPAFLWVCFPGFQWLIFNCSSKILNGKIPEMESVSVRKFYCSALV